MSKVRNLILEGRDVAGKVERFDAIAAEFVRLKVDVIVASDSGGHLRRQEGDARRFRSSW